MTTTRSPSHSKGASELTALILANLADPFRIALLIALFATMLRTRAATGTWLPLAAGALFVAVLLPMTLQASQAAPLWQAVAAGFLANALLLAVIFLLWEVAQRLRR